MLTDPIADMLTRIRNAGRAGLGQATMPTSRIRREIARILTESGFIGGYESGGESKKPSLTVEIRYDRESRPIIERIERMSRPGRRVYLGARNIPKVRNGLGIGIISTPKGLMTDEEARKAHLGGEFLARVW